MLRKYPRFAAFALAALVGGSLEAHVWVADAKPSQPATFEFLRSTDADTARGQALEWLKSVAKADDAGLKAFDAIWNRKDLTVLDQVIQTICLGDAEAAKLLAEARRPDASAPVELPNLLTDAKKPVFYRANLSLAYARALSSRRIYEEALEALNAVKAEQVVDPASYLFHKAVAEHALNDRLAANTTIIRMLDDCADTPERYKAVASLMVHDILGWQDKDLGWIARKMDNIERRLELSRGGPTTQKMQKQVVARLEEMIKELERPGGDGPGGDGPNNTIKPSDGQKESKGGDGPGPGNVDLRKLKEITDVWGKLPPREQARATQEMLRQMPPKYREIIENYFKSLDSGRGDTR
jgi:hypothetical protein